MKLSHDFGTFPLQLHLGIQHLLVDAVCAAAIFAPACERLAQYNGVVFMDEDKFVFFAGIAIAVYNTMAFCTQWLTGLFCDFLDRDRSVQIASVALLLSGVFLSMLIPIKAAILLGIGNSLFHVSGGRCVIRESGGKAFPLGAFVAPGAIGLFLGTSLGGTFFWLLPLLCICLIVNLGVLCFLMKKTAPAASPAENLSSPLPLSAGKILFIAVLVLTCIVCRAASGSVALDGDDFSLSWKWVPVLFVFLGKFWGGAFGDCFGITPVGVVALIAGTLLLCFGHSSDTFLAAQFCMNFLMALTLFLLARALPQTPGLAFGLAASVLYPGSLIRLTGSPYMILVTLSACSVLCFFVASRLLLNHPQKDKEGI